MSAESQERHLDRLLREIGGEDRGLAETDTESLRKPRRVEGLDIEELERKQGAE